LFVLVTRNLKCISINSYDKDDGNLGTS